MLNVLPRDERYFDKFTEMARRIHEGALTLNRYFSGETTVSAAAAMRPMSSVGLPPARSPRSRSIIASCLARR